MRGQNFDGYRPIKSSIAGAVHLSHAACPEWGQDFVGAQSSSPEISNPHSTQEWDKVYPINPAIRKSSQVRGGAGQRPAVADNH